MDFQQLADVAEKWCSSTPFELIAAEETERRMDFYADPGVSFYVLCPDNGSGDSFGNGPVFFVSPAPVGPQHVWSESEDCLPFLQLAQDYISSCGKKTLHEILEKVFKSFRPLLGLPDEDDAFEDYSADVEEEPEADHPQMGISLLRDTLRMNAVSHIQALAQTGKWLEEMALKIREGLDLVKAEDTAHVPSSLSELCDVLPEDIAGDSMYLSSS
ncbi:Maturin [Microtus ochrogaster]|uniref:Maturin n=1 Tax=Microtus ochrogaster TaxID=79684 RepID=A0A8J6KSB3_MICOH|nr:Maturin [Microtus ochrogaster]